MSALRVLHVIPSLDEADGGPVAALHVMERALAAEGIDCHTASTTERRPGPAGTPGADGIGTRHLFRRNTGFYKVSLPFSRWILAHARDYDVLHIHALFSFTSNMAAIAARRARVPYVIRPLGVLGHYGMRHRRPWLKQASLRLLEGPLLREAAAVHFTSEMERREAEELGYPLRSVVIPLALAASEAPEAMSLASLLPDLGPRRVVLYLSRLDPKKNVEGLIDAFAQVVARAPDAALVIAGEGPSRYVATLKARAAQRGIAQGVLWTGHVDGARKAALLREASLFVLPSHAENFGIAVAEALAAGLPCVAGRAVALAELAERAGAAISVATDAASIAGAIEAILLSPARRSEMARCARDVARREFDPAVMGRRLRELYEQVRSRRTP